MAYIGKEPIVGNFQKCDAISVVNGQAAYTLQVSSTNVVPESANHMLVSLNGILQAPVTSFTVSGSTLTFASNLATGDVIDFVILLGNVLDLGVPSDSTVTAAKIGANAVTAAKLNADIISGTTALASEPADTDEFLVSDAGVLKRIDYSLIKGGGITVASQWRLSAAVQGDHSTLSSNLEAVDTDSGSTLGSAMTESSGIFTFPSTGHYFICGFGNFYQNNGSNSRYANLYIDVTTDGSNYTTAANGSTQLEDNGASDWHSIVYVNFLFDVTNTSTHKLRFSVAVDDNDVYLNGATNHTETGFTFIKLADT